MTRRGGGEAALAFDRPAEEFSFSSSSCLGDLQLQPFSNADLVLNPFWLAQNSAFWRPLLPLLVLNLF